MAASASPCVKKSVLAIRIVLFFLFLSFGIDAHPLKICKFDQIYQLGDSISDTGNLIREVPIGASTAFARLPYGETFFKNPTGRCSDGLLMIDYIAMAAGVPLLPPYKNVEADFSFGVNFAVAGSTALPSEVLAAKHIFSPVTDSSFNIQLDWMSTHFNSICLNHRECVEKLQNALFMVGEIGGNDYNYAIFQGKTMEELISMVPEVVNAIMNGVRKAISFGATRMVVPGNFPIGCLPIYKTAFQTNISTAYDENQCLKQLNEFAMYHNELLKEGIDKLKQESPNVVIVYGDYYSAYKFLLKYAKSYGKSRYADMNKAVDPHITLFETQKACCGIGGKYNFNMTRMCGAPGVPVCKDPHRYVSWDGVHLTQNGYKIMAGWLVQDIFGKLLCLF
ncbi:Chlorogenate--glucarate O-hydroxycinnamoyltransferase [Handroanthus impetiginosus]|uniref:Chlorogenate--glucarate O-hydroxycinnamoyltransferase n=1 Tax=Handroanthus impetiginosus TaxID=429701 RepID=A0A2G9G9U1_9LAMI|nr:Chlorogenate--glucarate O-hydroxycinnamoyltransferase [Handroanthus impetiginosus]